MQSVFPGLNHVDRGYPVPSVPVIAIPKDLPLLLLLLLFIIIILLYKPTSIQYSPARVTLTSKLLSVFDLI